MQIPPVYLDQLMTYASCRGLASRATEMPKENSPVTMDEYLNQYERLLRCSNDPFFGLHFGVFLNLAALGSVYEVSLAATKMGQALRLWSDYAASNFPILSFDSEGKANSFVLQMDCEVKSTRVKEQIMDTFFTFVHRELRLMLGEQKMDVELPYHRLEEYEKWYRTPIRTGETYSFTFDHSIMDIEINKKRKKEIAVLLPSFLKMISLPGRRYKTFTASVRSMILNMCDPELPSLDQVASQFAMTNRTLQRKLEGENATFRKVLNDIKEELHTYLSKGQKIKTKDMAYLLGYSSPSAYLHALKKWKEPA
ncbi:MAG: AraC family transcriptional regulator ligand-binding domain-containing protein [Cytophagales bacterium]|nr:AraC family transcriptional regulator ligand-binding domain-containing protein [Cytophagales bacterium]